METFSLPQPFGLVDERPLLHLGEQLPLGAEPFGNLRIVHLGVVLGHLPPLSPRPHHERVHRPLDMLLMMRRSHLARGRGHRQVQHQSTVTRKNDSAFAAANGKRQGVIAFPRQVRPERERAAWWGRGWVSRGRPIAARRWGRPRPPRLVIGPRPTWRRGQQVVGERRGQEPAAG